MWGWDYSVSEKDFSEKQGVGAPRWRSCKLRGAKSGAREHLRVKGQEAMGAQVHLAALHPHKQAPAAGREREARQRAALPGRRSDGRVHIDDLRAQASRVEGFKFH